MYPNAIRTPIRVLVAAAGLCSAFCGGNAVADDITVTVRIPVSTQGLDLTRAADAQTLYSRLRNAAWLACTQARRTDLQPSDNPQACSEKALAEAVRAAQSRLLTQIYLWSHTPGEAITYGMDSTRQMAAK